jgi:hypothetical protein
VTSTVLEREVEHVSSSNTEPPVHYEHPERPGRSLCGAEVFGVRLPLTTPVDCADCIDLNWGAL